MFFPLVSINVNGISAVKGVIESESFETAREKLNVLARVVGVPVGPSGVGYGGSSCVYRVLDTPLLTADKIKEIFAMEKQALEYIKNSFEKSSRR